MASGAVTENAEDVAGQKLYKNGIAILNGQQLIEGAAIQNPNVPAPLGADGNSNRLVKSLSGMADAADVALFTITIPNVLSGASIRVIIHGMLGDGDSADSAVYTIGVSRIAGANAKAVASAKSIQGQTIGATGNAAVIITVPAVTGAVGASNTFVVTARVTRSAGAATNHKVTAEIELLCGTGGVQIS